MDIGLEFLPRLLAILAFDFLLYFIGASVLKVISFGMYQSKICNYSEFKKLKAKTNNSFFLQYVFGLLFFALIIFVIAWFN